MVADMGYKAMLTEGAKHILGWKSPNFLYCNAINPRLKVLLKNYKLSDDIAFRFGNKSWSEWPLTAPKFVDWLKKLDSREEVINLFMDYETFGEHQDKSTGIFEFLENIPIAAFKTKELSFSTPSEIAESLQPVAPVSVPHPISWADEERDLTAWLGNEMQEEAFNKLYALLPKIAQCNDPKLLKDWNFLQSSDHFYYMCTKFFSDGDVHAYFNPYETPYQAFINYMNVLSDFTIRLNAAVPKSGLDQEIANLTEVLNAKEEKIKKMEDEIQKLRKRRMSSKAPASGKSKAKAVNS
jgi:alpha-amylase